MTPARNDAERAALRSMRGAAAVLAAALAVLAQAPTASFAAAHGATAPMAGDASALRAIAAPVHAFHASLAEVEYNEQAKTVEVALRLFPDDLESALGRRAKSRVRLDATPGVDKLALAYVRESFTLARADGAALQFQWVGMELRVDSVWVYVQADAPGGLDGARLADTLFFDLYDDQVNVANVKQGSAKASLSFKSGDAAQPIALKPGS